MTKNNYKCQNNLFLNRDRSCKLDVEMINNSKRIINKKTRYK